jgi:undecaprenyl-diphosphatase
VLEALSTLDRNLFFLINSWNTGWLNPVMVFLSGQIIWLPLIGIMVWTAFTQLNRRSFGIFFLFLLLALVASDVTSSYLLKNIVQRLRPCRVPEIKALIINFGQKCGGRFGFVSSHAANSFCLMSFAFLALELKSSKYYWLWLLPLFVSISRIYLGVHYPGDIIGGIIIGGTWAWIFSKFFKLRRQTT